MNLSSRYPEKYNSLLNPIFLNPVKKSLLHTFMFLVFILGRLVISLKVDIILGNKLNIVKKLKNAEK